MNLRRRSMRMVVLAAVSWLVAVVVVQCWLPHVQHGAPHTPHPLAAAVGGEFTVNADHAHFSDNSTPPCQLDMVAVPLSRSNATIFTPASVVPVAGLVAAHAHPAESTGRAPPRALDSSTCGQDLLTRYCLARR
ncbi:hypothetical protein A5645_06705 [Mycobacterium asiaticum]|uniref:hypothetical protein n=1 Tax=Mycobacterium asiaticum TaxID=1790 RepID=UPI0007EFC491|nr:hypothetical protein [Mycobacterium asiaticum]OBK97211.1 hypothetical protein A5645_06705 [Mycobacterium asiaticum]